MSWKRSVLPISCGDVTAHGTNARRPDYSSSSYRADEHVHGWWRRFVPNPLASVSAKAVQAAGARARLRATYVGLESIRRYGSSAINPPPPCWSEIENIVTWYRC
jgi:hypothetical protein